MQVKMIHLRTNEGQTSYFLRKSLKFAILIANEYVINC